MSADDLKKQLADGRGIWIGLFVGREVTLGEYVCSDPHVTLAHLGRGGPPDLVDRAIACLEETVASRVSPSTVVHGSARLEQSRGSAVVLLLDDGLSRMRTGLGEQLRRWRINADQTFGWTPHLTVQKIGESDEATLPRIKPKSVKFQFPEISLVVGDARKNFRFSTDEVIPF